jgi:two-component system, OmpR family, sensor histidine kinase CpxA
MRGIAFKIFLSFWTIFAVLIASFALLPDRGIDVRLSDQLRLVATAGATLLEQQGAQACGQLAAALEQNGQMTLTLSDASGAIVCASPTRPEGDRAIMLMVETPRGATIRARGAPGPAYADIGVRPPFPFRAVALAILVSGIVCFAMARYLAAPLRRIRDASYRLARGDLQARAGSYVGVRRDEIGELVRDFDAMAERIEDLVGTQTQLLSDISHELRSPLARLHVALELARLRAGTEIPEFDRIETEALRMNELIGRLLALVRAESGVANELEQVDIATIIQQVTDDAHYEAQRQHKSVELRINAAPVIRGNSRLIGSAVDNVVRNALRHTRENTAVEVTLTREADQVAIAVRDHGPAVPASELTRIFAPFYRVGRARDRETGGVGLGLAIAKRAAAFHGGDIRAQIHSEGGLVVTITLPLGPASANTALSV